MSEKNLVQQIDKVSYGIAAVLGLALIALPFFAGGDVDKIRNDLNAEVRTYQQKSEEPLLQDPVVDVVGILRSQWDPGVGSTDAGWLTEAAPALIKRTQEIQAVASVHEPAAVAQVSCLRDAQKKKVYLLVEGKMSSINENIVLEKVRLLRSEGEGGSFRELSLEADGDFQYPDFDVEPGKTYTYKIITEAVEDRSVEHVEPLAARRQESEVLGPTEAIPYDFNFRVSNVLVDGTDTRVLCRYQYWDYAKGEVVTKSSTTLGERVKFGNDRYEIRRIDEASKSVTIIDSSAGVRGARYPISRKDRPFTVELWSPLVGASEDDGDGTEGDEEPAEVEAVPEPSTDDSPAPTRRPRRGNRGFGGN